jgi:hypothetical protein
MSGARFENGQLVDVPPGTIEEAITESQALMRQGLVMPESAHGPKPLAAIVGVTSGRLEPEEAAAAEQARLRELIERGEARKLAGFGVVVRANVGYCSTCKSLFVEYFRPNGERLSQPGCSRCAERLELSTLVGQEANWVRLPDTAEVMAEEWGRLRSQSPSLAKLLAGQMAEALDAHAESTRIRIGARHVARSLWTHDRAAALGEAVAEAFGKLAAGDFGRLGSLADADDLDDPAISDDTRFAPELASPLQRNLLALEAGTGPVRASYVLADALGWELFPRNRQDAYTIDVVTIQGEPVASYLRVVGSGRPWKPAPVIVKSRMK